MRTCVTCDVEFVPNADQQRFCSRGCSNRFRADPSARHSKLTAHVCAMCLQGFKGRRQRLNGALTYCSNTCRQKAQSLSIEQRVGKVYKLTACAECGTEFVTPFAQTKVCPSKVCFRRARARMSREYWAAHYEPVPRRDRLVDCAGCGEPFLRPAYSVAKKWCGPCKKWAISDSWHRRRDRLKNGDLPSRDSLVAVRRELYEQANGICQLCGTPVLPLMIAPDPMSATIDHIIPLAKGGRHTRDNIQLAHFICNSRKSDRIGGTGKTSQKLQIVH